MIEKLAATLEMSFKVPDSEKEMANQAIKYFFSSINSITIIKDYLDKVYDPFKNAQSISPEALIEFRGKLNIIKSQIKEKFKILKKNSIKALKALNYFATDTHCIELINAFKESMGDVFSSAEKLTNILDDYTVSNFKDKIIASIDNVRKELNQVEELSRSRIIDHLKNNIVGNGWVNQEEHQESVKEKIPTVIEIYKNINKDIEGGHVPQIQKRPQSLNFSDSQKIFYPQDLRNATEIAQ